MPTIAACCRGEVSGSCRGRPSLERHRSHGRFCGLDRTSSLHNRDGSNHVRMERAEVVEGPEPVKAALVDIAFQHESRIECPVDVCHGVRYVANVRLNNCRTEIDRQIARVIAQFGVKRSSW